MITLFCSSFYVYCLYCFYCFFFILLFILFLFYLVCIICYCFVLFSYCFVLFLVDLNCWPSPHLRLFFDFQNICMVFLCVFLYFWLIIIVGPRPTLGYFMFSYGFVWFSCGFAMFLTNFYYWASPDLWLSYDFLLHAYRC